MILQIRVYRAQIQGMRLLRGVVCPKRSRIHYQAPIYLLSLIDQGNLNTAPDSPPPDLVGQMFELSHHVEYS